ncbi:deoxyribose-phosphate aldolase [Sarcina sp. JB2]|uniref:Deoxyribose-phosphate aldolase n=1 Tax=Candidatus Sarcina troglodytae TaxID=2726954 RepID=A0ACD1BF94_9CLOT|nr:deoxyribose-phosphate aldolase [Sarcina sp. JB2]QPJ85937.1 deoxyribose-phosphate aldolase [Sarcina sp. JB2]
MEHKDIYKIIDHTLLKQDATSEEIKNLCKEALEYNFASVCVNPTNVELAAKILNGSLVKVCTVIGFPLGANTTKIKVLEAKDAIENGATEVDMVINIGRLKDKDYDYVKKDIEAVVNEVKGKALIKVIIETCLLTDEEKVVACKLASEAKADFVKTSTGFSTGGATPFDVKLMRETVGENMGVKASGGIRTSEDAKELIKNGANRIGASASIKICTE